MPRRIDEDGTLRMGGVRLHDQLVVARVEAVRSGQVRARAVDRVCGADVADYRSCVIDLVEATVCGTCQPNRPSHGIGGRYRIAGPCSLTVSHRPGRRAAGGQQDRIPLPGDQRTWRTRPGRGSVKVAARTGGHIQTGRAGTRGGGDAPHPERWTGHAAGGRGGRAVCPVGCGRPFAGCFATRG